MLDVQRDVAATKTAISKPRSQTRQQELILTDYADRYPKQRQLVTKDESYYADVPARFEAGTPPIAQAVGLGWAYAKENAVTSTDHTRDKTTNSTPCGLLMFLVFSCSFCMFLMFLL